jgi:hypothetical protein
MLAKLQAAFVVLSAFLSKASAKVIACLVIVVTYGPTVLAFMQSAPGTSLQALVPDGKTILAWCVSLLTLLHQQQPTSSFGQAVDAALSKTNKAGQAGMVRMGALLAILVLGLFVVFLPAANCKNDPAFQTAATTAPADLELTVCEGEIIANDTAAGDSWEQIVDDSLNPTSGCTGDVTQIVNDIDGAVVSQMVGGKLTPAQANDALARVHVRAKLPAPKTVALPAAKSHS